MMGRRFKLSAVLAVAAFAIIAAGASTAKADPWERYGRSGYRSSYYYRDSGCYEPRPYYRSSYYYSRSYCEPAPCYPRGGFGFSFSYGRDCRDYGRRSYRSHCGW